MVSFEIPVALAVAMPPPKKASPQVPEWMYRAAARHETRRSWAEEVGVRQRPAASLAVSPATLLEGERTMRNRPDEEQLEDEESLEQVKLRAAGTTVLGFAPQRMLENVQGRPVVVTL